MIVLPCLQIKLSTETFCNCKLCSGIYDAIIGTKRINLQKIAKEEKSRRCSFSGDCCPQGIGLNLNFLNKNVCCYLNASAMYLLNYSGVKYSEISQSIPDLRLSPVSSSFVEDYVGYRTWLIGLRDLGLGVNLDFRKLRPQISFRFNISLTCKITYIFWQIKNNSVKIL